MTTESGDSNRDVVPDNAPQHHGQLEEGAPQSDPAEVLAAGRTPVDDAGNADPDADQVMPGDAGQDPRLPQPVANRVAQLAVQAVHALPPTDVPAAMRFALGWRRRGPLPTRFAHRVLAALAQDEGLRARIGSHLAGEGTAVGEEMAEGSGGGDPVTGAAMLYLSRPEHWQRDLSAALSATATQPAQADELVAAQQQAADLRTRLERLQQRREQEAATAKRDQAEVRTKLSGQIERLREELRALRGESERLASELEQSRRAASDLDREVRRLRSRLDSAQSAAEQAKGADRSARLLANARVKALLEVLGEAAAGLAEELRLPASTTAPAEHVAAVEPAQPTVSKRIHTAEDLTQALTLPRCHLLVDGYNITKGAWASAPLQQQRDRLVTALAPLAARTRAEVTVVFDGAEVGPVPAAPTAKGVRVRFSPPGEVADRVIVRMVAAEPTGRPVVVASSDAALCSGARSAGGRTADREVLLAALGV